MSAAKEKSKFVSSIPNNKLEPVFIGRSDTDTSVDPSSDKKSGVYVPAFLKGKQNDVRSTVHDSSDKKSVQKKPQLNTTEFPDLPTSKAKLQQLAAPSGRISFLDMLKKPKPEPVAADVVENQVVQRGIVVLGRGIQNSQKLSSSWAEETEDIDYSAPVRFEQQYYEEDEQEDDYVEDEEYYPSLRR
jgi:hypothetical protein